MNNVENSMNTYVTFEEENWAILQYYPEYSDVWYRYGVKKDFIKKKDDGDILINGGTYIPTLEGINIRIDDKSTADIVTFDYDTQTIYLPSSQPDSVKLFRNAHPEVISDIARIFKCTIDDITDRMLLSFSFAQAVGSAIQVIANPQSPLNKDVSMEIARNYLRQNKSKFINLPVYIAKDKSEKEIAKERDGWDVLETRLPFVKDTDEFKLVNSAYYGAFNAHKIFNQPRKNGEPYIMHPLEVTLQIIEEGVTDANTIAASLFHDVQEDTFYIQDHPEGIVLFYDENLILDDGESNEDESETISEASLDSSQDIEDLMLTADNTAFSRLGVMFNQRFKMIMEYITQEENEEQYANCEIYIQKKYAKKIANGTLSVNELEQLVKNRYKKLNDIEYLKKIKASRIEKVPEVIIIKQSDNLHNLRTLDAVEIEKQVKKVKEIEEQLLPVYRKKLLFNNNVDQETQVMFENARKSLLKKIEFEIEIRKIIFRAQGIVYK